MLGQKHQWEDTERTNSLALAAKNQGWRRQISALARVRASDGQKTLNLKGKPPLLAVPAENEPFPPWSPAPAGAEEIKGGKVIVKLKVGLNSYMVLMMNKF